MKNKFILDNSKYIESCNCEDRPNNTVVDSIIIHCISLPENEYDNDNVINLFTNTLDINLHNSFQELKNIRVSSHLFIRRHGDLIQFVPLDKKAWHAGKSKYMNRENFNDFSIDFSKRLIQTEEEASREDFKISLVDLIKDNTYRGRSLRREF